jgi:hypothetical protein
MTGFGFMFGVSNGFWEATHLLTPERRIARQPEYLRSISACLWRRFSFVKLPAGWRDRGIFMDIRFWVPAFLSDQENCRHLGNRGGKIERSGLSFQRNTLMTRPSQKPVFCKINASYNIVAYFQ